jgi:hypothetical protein
MLHEYTISSMRGVSAILRNVAESMILPLVTQIEFCLPYLQPVQQHTVCEGLLIKKVVLKCYCNLEDTQDLL